MKDLGEHTRVSPEVRQKRCMDFIRDMKRYKSSHCSKPSATQLMSAFLMGVCLALSCTGIRNVGKSWKDGTLNLMTTWSGIVPGLSLLRLFFKRVQR